MGAPVTLVDPDGVYTPAGGAGGGLTDAQLRATPVPVSGTVATGGLTDAQLRAAAVPVSGTVTATGPLTDTQLRATAVPVSGTVTATGPLTDTQLRATPVPVSGTVTATVDTSALATATKQDTQITAEQAILAKIIAAPATEAKQDTGNTSATATAAALGTTAGAAVVTDANGTVQQYLRGLVVRMLSFIGPQTGAASLSVVPASDGLFNVQPHSLTANRWQYAAAASGIVNTTTAVTFIAAGGASIRNYVTGIQVMFEALTAASELAIRDGAAGTVIWRTKIPAGTAGFRDITFPVPLKGTANTLMEVVTLTASGAGAVYYNAQGFTGA